MVTARKLNGAEDSHQSNLVSLDEVSPSEMHSGILERKFHPELGRERWIFSNTRGPKCLQQ